ncbi:hypothetical protein [Halocella sp. SP3-1]|uniref:hypothetical protein n=1 Tax=Halocella sp. SP3-1 TaxID=2382161 RepID=UPI000F7627A8|nr:hypothetical protein [Halocella sp. SP3-1]AZO94223.1 hypothetical protein D7D81_06220 [Halocella sp. SP3-1]
MLLNRSQIIRRLIEVRRFMYENKHGDIEKGYLKIKKDLDELIYDIVGDFLNETDRAQLDNILEKSISGEIPVDMAMVAIKELAISYYENGGIIEEEGKDNTADHFYKKGYR